MAIRYFYVTKGATVGTAVNDAGSTETKRTTQSWATMGAAACFPTVAAAIATSGTAMKAGDVIFLASDHDAQYGANTTLAFPTGTGALVRLASTDVNDVVIYLAGADESCSGTNFDIIPQGRMESFGVNFTPTDDLLLTNANAVTILNNATITFESTADRIQLTSQSLILNDVIITGTGDHSFVIDGGALFEMNGGSLFTSGTWTSLVGEGSLNGFGGKIRLTGVDISTLTGYLIEDVGADAGDDMFDIVFDRCKISASLTGFLEEVPTQPHQRVLATNCSGVSADAEYQFFQRTWAGDVEDETGTIRADAQDGLAAGTGFDGGVQVSMKATPNAACSIDTPLVFDFPSRFVKLSDGSTDTITIFFAVDDGTDLTDADVYFEVSNPDGTNKQTWNWDSTAPALSGEYILNPLDAGNTHSTDGSSTWEDGEGSDKTGLNEYSKSLTISGGADSVPLIRIFVTKPSVSTGIFFDVVLGVGAG